MTIRTKILATIGPSSGSPKVLRELLHAGCDVFRINFSHGSAEQREAFLRSIRDAEQELGRPIAVCADLCGPKIRVGTMSGGGALLAEGQAVTIQRDPIEGDAVRISTTLPELIDEAKPGEALLLDDGKIRLEVVEVDPPRELRCKVVRGGVLGSGKGINVPDTDLSLSALTEKDRADVQWITEREFEYVALSFVRKADDIRELRALLRQAGSDAHIIAKIEKPEALRNIDAIIAAADGIMVARGDLGVEMELPQVPLVQKQITAACQSAGKFCIIATQMLESMIHNATPTRAEVSDVANAVLDHTDAVMLSGETAVGEYPVDTVKMMNQTVAAVQQSNPRVLHSHAVESTNAPVTAAIARAVRSVVDAEEISAIAVYTATGATALLLAKNRMPVPILALSPDPEAVRRMGLYYGVIPRNAETPEHTRDVLRVASRQLQDLGIVNPGDRIVVVSGRPVGEPGCTNTMVVHQIGNEQDA